VRCQAPLRETLRPFGASPTSKSQTLALSGLLQAATRVIHPIKLPHAQGDILAIKRKMFHLKWVNPPRLGSTKVSWVERPSSSHV
jgi:hypothetical protein